MSDERRARIKGAVVACATAATKDYDVDYDRLREQYRFIVEGGLQNGTGVLLAVGGGGEGYFLNEKQWYESVRIFAEEAVGKVTTMVGLFELNAQHAVEKIQFAEKLGIEFIQTAPPHYEKPTDSEVFAYYKMLSDALTKTGLIIYHTYWSMPEDYEMTTPLIARMADLDNVVGIKWASTRLTNFTQVLFGFRDRLAFIDNQGWTNVLGEAHGIDAFMFFGGNFDPLITVKISKHFMAGEYDEYCRVIEKVMGFREPLKKAILEEVHGPGSSELKTIGEGTLAKATMDIFDRPMGPAFPPQHNLSEKAKERVKEQITALKT